MHILHHSNLRKWTVRCYQVQLGLVVDMDFSEYLQLLHKYVGTDVKQQDFLLFLIHELMHEPVTEEEIKDDELEKYYPYYGNKKNKSMLSKIYAGDEKVLPKSKARQIRNAYDFKKCGLLDLLSSLSDDKKRQLIQNLSERGFTTTKADVALYCCKMMECFLDNLSMGVNIVNASSVVVPADDIPEIYDDRDLKRKYGAQLLAEVNNMCPNDRCSTPLYIVSNNCSEPEYEIVQISDKYSRDNVENLIALCPECSKKYRMNHTEEETERLANIKTDFSTYNEARYAVSRDELVKGVEKVITKISSIPEKNLMELNLNPAAIKDKIDGSDNHLLGIISFTNAEYFDDIHDLFKGAEEEGLIDFDRFCYQIRYKYKDIAERGISQRQIFDLLAEWLMGLTNEKKSTCEAVISYFVQKCEVFDAISK